MVKLYIVFIAHCLSTDSQPLTTGDLICPSPDQTFNSVCFAERKNIMHNTSECKEGGYGIVVNYGDIMSLYCCSRREPDTSSILFTIETHRHTNGDKMTLTITRKELAQYTYLYI